MSENKRYPLQTDDSFADSTLLSFSYDDSNQSLKVLLELWNEKKIELKMEDVVYFLYQPGDIISEIYETPNSLIKTESLINQNTSKLNEISSLKLVEFFDINDFAFIKVACNKIYIIK